MRHRLGTLSCLVMTVAVVGLMVPAATAGQATGAWTLPRTPDGHPDLQGVWANNNVTPLERPEAWADKDTLTDEELAALQVAAADAVGAMAVIPDTAPRIIAAKTFLSLITVVPLNFG